MKLSLGIVGLPNVGKSTLFNALTNNQVPAENYPFNTIDPNLGVVPVQDNRINQLVELIKPQKVTPAVVEFWDIAGLVKGAASGAGLGNKFLANIRNVSAIVHVVRAFENANIQHVENNVDPLRDLELINTELILKDLDTLTAAIPKLQSRLRADKKLQPIVDSLTGLQAHLEQGKLAHSYEVPADEDIQAAYSELFLLTSKPVIYVINTTNPDNEPAVQILRQHVPANSLIIPMDIKLEAEISELPEADRQEYLRELGMDEPALAKLTRAAYEILGLISFFTAGEQEVRAWTIAKGFKAPQAAGVIHTDFEKKFITAEIVKQPDFISAGGWAGAKEKGVMKLAGKEYVMEDGDVVLFRHG